METIAALVAKPAAKWILGAALVLALVGGTVFVLRSEFAKGEKSGASTVTNAVQSQTIRTLERARVEQEKINEQVRQTPYDDLVDGLR